MTSERLTAAEWLAEQIGTVPHTHDVITPSEWAERRRYLPPSVSVMPGPFRFSRSPFLREIVDCLSVDSPIREVVLMKGVQIGATTGVLENAIGYFIEHVATSPMMLVTADRELAQLRLESNIVTMVQQSDLAHLIKSSDEKNARKTGSTTKKIEWVGGGFLLPFGANSANKMRQTSIEVMFRDEIDGWPADAGRQGDPLELTFGRTKSYEATRKIVDASTPLLKGTSKIEQRFRMGDQRHYYVRCLKCGFPQVLSGYSGDFKWRTDDHSTGEMVGMVWETEGGRLVEESVRYVCRDCGHAHGEHDKPQLFSPEHGAEWRPTAAPSSPVVRSYHLSALYSLTQSWVACVHAWRKAWDDERNQPRDNASLQVFYNNILGLTFAVRGDRVMTRHTNRLRRPEYLYGQVPNRFAVQHTGGPISILTCAVDVHADRLPTAVMGWARGRCFLIDYWSLEGETDNLDDGGSWDALRKIIEEKEYVADDGRRYRIAITLVDSRYRADHVYKFCERYESGVYPIGGRTETRNTSSTRHFQPYDKNPSGVVAYGVTVDRYKDRWAPALRREWNGIDTMPPVFFNAPVDATETQLKEFTAENRREVRDEKTGQSLGWKWHRTGPNELWDLLVYNSAALDIVAWDVFRNQLERNDVDWDEFFTRAEEGALYHEMG